MFSCRQTPVLFRGIGMSIPPESRLVCNLCRASNAVLACKMSARQTRSISRTAHDALAGHDCIVRISHGVQCSAWEETCRSNGPGRRKRGSHSSGAEPQWCPCRCRRVCGPVQRCFLSSISPRERQVRCVVSAGHKLSRAFSNATFRPLVNRNARNIRRLFGKANNCNVAMHCSKQRQAPIAVLAAVKSCAKGIQH